MQIFDFGKPMKKELFKMLNCKSCKNSCYTNKINKMGFFWLRQADTKDKMEREQKKKYIY